MSYLLELLGRGLDHDLGDVLARYYWSPSRHSLDELGELAEQTPDLPDVQCQFGVALLRAVQLPHAIERLSIACRLKPDYLAARLALAAAYDESGQAAAAIEHLQIANMTHTGDVRILFALGYGNEKCQRPAQAAGYYRDAIAADGEFLPARQRLAAIAVALDETDEAIAQYQHLRDAQPEQIAHLTALGHLHYRQKQFPEAIECFRRAIAMEPENWSLLDDEVEALVADGQVREAIEHLHDLIDLQPGFPDFQVRLADLYSDLGDDAAAMEHLHQALDLQPDYLEAQVKIGTQHLISGRWDQAGEAFQQACQLNDRSIRNYVALGVAQLSAGDTPTAMESFELAGAMEPNSEMLLAEMARLQLKVAVASEFLQGAAEAPDQDEPTIELDHDDLLHQQIQRHEHYVAESPGRADAHYRCGVLLRSVGRLGEAMEQFTQAVAINPTYVDAIIKLGLTQQDMGHVDDAIATLTGVLEIEPDYVDVHYRLGLLHTDRRLFEQAVRHMEAAAAGQPDSARLRAGLALALQNMGLMDRAAATWRSLWQIHRQRASR